MQSTYQMENQMEGLSTIEDVRKYLDANIQCLDLEFQNPPYTQMVYNSWRRQIFLNYLPLKQVMSTEERNHIMYELVQVIDEEYLNMFHMLLNKPYHELIMTKHLNIPKEIDVDKASQSASTAQALQQLVASISEWNIQIEKLTDQLYRSELYQLWVPKFNSQKGKIGPQIKSILAPNSDFSYTKFTRHVVLNLLSSGAVNVSKLLQTMGLSHQNLTLGSALVLFHIVRGQNGIAWSLINKAINLQWLAGGMAGSYVLKYVSSYITSYDEIEQITECTRLFQEILLKLVEINDQITKAVNACFQTKDDHGNIQKKIRLSQILDDFLEDPISLRDGINRPVIECEMEDWLMLDEEK